MRQTRQQPTENTLSHPRTISFDKSLQAAAANQIACFIQSSSFISNQSKRVHSIARRILFSKKSKPEPSSSSLFFLDFEKCE